MIHAEHRIQLRRPARSQVWRVAAEDYADYGPLHEFLPAAQQSHQLFAVVNRRAGKVIETEVGVGFGLTDASDRLTLKLLLMHDLNHQHQD